jgi:hypothetical protein
MNFGGCTILPDRGHAFADGPKLGWIICSDGGYVLLSSLSKLLFDNISKLQMLFKSFRLL